MKKTKTQPETYIRRQVRDYLEKIKGCFVWYNMQGALSEHGIPDLMAVRLVKKPEFKQIIEKALSGEVIRQDMLLDRIYDVLVDVGLMCQFRAIEIKTKKGRLSDDQAAFLVELRAQGCMAQVATGYEDLETK